jgi:hypothetical protein
VTEAAAVTRPRRTWVVAAVGVLLVALLVGWLAYAQGQRNAGRDAAADAAQRRLLSEQLDALRSENQQLHAKVAELEMARRLDRDAYGQVERTLGELQAQLARQGDDLAFYRSIVSPEDGVQGLRIQRFEVVAGSEPREFQLRLTLVQAMRHESVVAGLAQVALVGTQRGVPQRYTVGDLIGRPRAQLPFSFRYFQTLEQAVTLPEGFEPYEAEVRLQSSKLRGPVQQSYPWRVARRAAL